MKHTSIAVTVSMLMIAMMTGPVESFAWSGNSEEIANYAETHYTTGQYGGQCAVFVKNVLQAVTGIYGGTGWVTQSGYETQLKRYYDAKQVSLSDVKRGDIITLNYPHIAIVSQYTNGTLYVTESNYNHDERIHVSVARNGYLASQRNPIFWRIGSESPPPTPPTTYSWRIDDKYVGGGWERTNPDYLFKDKDVVSGNADFVDDFDIDSMNLSLTGSQMTVDIHTDYWTGAGGLQTDFGDLFLSIDGLTLYGEAPYFEDTSLNSTVWEYVFDVSEGQLYDIRGAQDHILLSDDVLLGWDDEDYRHNQEVWIDPIGLTAIGQGSAGRVGDYYSLSFDMTSLYLDPLNLNLGFHWTQTCGNDVIEGGIVTPEPSTMLLLGCGLVGIAVFSRKRTKKACS